MELSKQQQLEFLFSIVTEASKWEKSDGDDRDSIRMEVEERIAELIRGGTVVENGRIQSILHPDTPKLDIKFLDTPKQKRTVRVMIDGHSRCVPIEACLQLPFQKSRTGYKWAIDPNSQWAMDHLVGRCDEGTHQT